VHTTLLLRYAHLPNVVVAVEVSEEVKLVVCVEASLLVGVVEMVLVIEELPVLERDIETVDDRLLLPVLLNVLVLEKDSDEVTVEVTVEVADDVRVEVLEELPLVV
jgi:hypothetical protein